MGKFMIRRSEEKMLSAARPIYERCNKELLKNTEEEACTLEERYFNNKREKIIDSINFILTKRPKSCRLMLKTISESQEYEHEFKMYLDLRYIKTISSYEESENTSFYQLSSLEEIVKRYKLIYLVLMRIALGTVMDIDDYLLEVMNLHQLSMEDLVFVAQVENINF